MHENIKITEKNSLLNDFCGLFKLFAMISCHRTLLKQLIQRNIKNRYNGTILGLAWCIIHPLAMLSIYVFIFSCVFSARWVAVGVKNPVVGESKWAFAVIMYCGMAIYSVFAESIALAPSIIVSNVNFVKKVIFPIEILPISYVVAVIVVNFFSFAVLFAGAVFFMDALSWKMLFVPLIMLPFYFYILGWVYFIASLGVFFRDIAQFISLITQVLFLMTPIFYSIDMVPKRFQIALKINPLTWFVEEVRKVFLFNTSPDWKSYLLLFGCSFIVFILGFLWFKRTQRGFADVL